MDFIFKENKENSVSGTRGIEDYLNGRETAVNASSLNIAHELKFCVNLCLLVL